MTTHKIKHSTLEPPSDDIGNNDKNQFYSFNKALKFYRLIAGSKLEWLTILKQQ